MSDSDFNDEVEARLRAHLVDGEKTPDWYSAFECAPPTVRLTSPEMTDEEYADLRRRWQEFDMKIVDDHPVFFLPVGISLDLIVTKSHRDEEGTLVIDDVKFASDPGDETTYYDAHDGPRD